MSNSGGIKFIQEAKDLETNYLNFQFPQLRNLSPRVIKKNLTMGHIKWLKNCIIQNYGYYFETKK